MRAGRKSRSGKGAFEIIEEVFHLLRTAPAGALAAYYVGTLPFVLALLYFWADMSKSAFAHARAAQGALFLTVLFVWMKAWHSVYARLLWGEVCGRPAPRLSFIRWARTAIRQTIVQSTGFLVLPAALLAAVPFAWTYALYQNMTVLDDGAPGSVRGLVGRSVELARPWQKQNLILIWALSPFLMVTAVVLYLVLMPLAAALTPAWTAGFLAFYSALYILLLMPLSPFGIVVAANIAAALLVAPGLLDVFLGIQTAAVTNWGSLLNSTFFAVVCALTYCCMDPLMKAAYVLRCFYAESIHTGEDLRVQLKRPKPNAAVFGALFAIGLLFCNFAVAQDSASSIPEIQNPKSKIQNETVVSPGDLSAALDRELQARRYAWRLPRVKPSEEEEGIVLAFLRDVGETLANWWRTAKEWLGKAADWLRRLFPASGGPSPARRLSSVGGILRLALYALLAALACAVVYMLWRVWQQRRLPSPRVAAEPVASAPDLDDEGTRADALPEGGWLALARDLAEQGDLRLALRAAFLASLAGLAEADLVHIARFKSNRDYQKELDRRAHAQPGVLDLFTQSTGIYERVWYGTHETTRDMLNRVLANQEQLRAHG